MNSVLDTLQATAATAPAQKTPVQETEERFLTLLVTQMKNQDPLNPLDNAQVTTQLAQLNTASGISQLNQTLAGLAASFAASQTLQSAALIGRGVMLPGSDAPLAGGQALFGAELAQPVDSLEVEISDAAGKVVHHASAGPQPAGIVGLHWDGATDAGGTAADGLYRFKLTARAGGKAVQANPLAVGLVQSVTPLAAGAVLNLQGGASVPLTDIRQIL